MKCFSDLSIVIPVGPNDCSWQNLLNELLPFGDEVEIIISACQSQPARFKFANNVKWLQSNQGRAVQQNGGAELGTRKIIWFLHADSQLSEGIVNIVRQFIGTSTYDVGYFRLQFADDGPNQTQMNAWAANIRSRYFGLPFGDQGFIMAKDIFNRMDGFDQAVLVGEDLDFVVRLKGKGINLQELPGNLTTSSRRYQQSGWLLTTIRHIWLTCLLTRQAKQRLATQLGKVEK